MMHLHSARMDGSTAAPRRAALRRAARQSALDFNN